MHFGEKNTLRVLRHTSAGAFLSDDDGEEVLLPNKYVPATLNVGDDIEVFVYNDSEDRPVATTITPKIKLHEFAFLQAKAVNEVGAFMDWGLEKDLLVPFKEQTRRMVKLLWYVVYLYRDPLNGRLVGSGKIRKFLEDAPEDMEAGQAVDLLVYERTDLGMNVIVDNKYHGLLYANEIFQPVYPGDVLKGYVKKVRDDHNLDISLQKQGFDNVTANAARILEVLENEKGFLALTDSSAPEDIYDMLGMSKKTFKRAVGTLYKEKKVFLKEDGIYLSL